MVVVWGGEVIVGILLLLESCLLMLGLLYRLGGARVKERGSWEVPPYVSCPGITYFGNFFR